MAKRKAAERAPELREFIKENDQRLYDFCYYMLDGGAGRGAAVDDVILSIFRDFGDHYRKLFGKREAWEQPEIRLRLFKTAWERIRSAITHVQYTWPMGRDTRQLKGLDDDLLRGWTGKERDLARVEAGVLERLSRIDADFRAALVLRDILKFDDEEVVRILGIRWGVYRHRLHRGRLELKDGLRARPVSSEAKGIATPFSSGSA